MWFGSLQKDDLRLTARGALAGRVESFGVYPKGSKGPNKGFWDFRVEGFRFRGLGV